MLSLFSLHRLLNRFVMRLFCVLAMLLQLSLGVRAQSAPSAPTGLTATAGDSQISLSWTASAGATTYKVKFAYTSGGPSYSTVASPATTSYTDAGLTNGTAYFFVVSAINAAGESLNSTEVRATPQPPAVPQGGSNTFPATLENWYSDGDGVVSWVVYNADGYISTYDSTGDWDVIYDAGTGMVSVSAPSTAPLSDEYTVEVSSENWDDGELRFYTEAHFRVVDGGYPPPPPDLAARAGDKQVFLTWVPVPGATAYKVGGSNGVAATVSTTSYTDTGLTNGTLYYYAVCAIRDGKESVYSKTVSAQPLALKPPPSSSGALHIEIVSPSDVIAGALYSAQHQSYVGVSVSDVNDSWGTLAGRTVTFSVTDADPAYPSSVFPVTCTTDAQGHVSTIFTSSRKVGQSSIVKATCGPLQATTTPIISKATEGKRGYGIKAFNQGYDQDVGWNIGWNDDGEGNGPNFRWGSDPLFYNRHEIKNCSFYLKFRRDASQTPDKNYFIVNYVPTTSIDANNDGWISYDESYNNEAKLASGQGWESVKGHRLEIRIAQITLLDGSVIMGPDGQYAYLVDKVGQRLDQNGFVVQTTNADGRAYFFVRSGPLIQLCKEIRFKAKDTTQVKVAVP